MRGGGGLFFFFALTLNPEPLHREADTLISRPPGCQATHLKNEKENTCIFCT